MIAAHDHVGDAGLGQDLRHLRGPAGDVGIEVDPGIRAGDGPLEPETAEIRLPDELFAREERFVRLVEGCPPLHPPVAGQAADLLGALGVALEVFHEIEHILHGERVGRVFGHHGQCRGDAVRVAEDDAFLGGVHPGDVLVARGDDVEPALRRGEKGQGEGGENAKGGGERRTELDHGILLYRPFSRMARSGLRSRAIAGSLISSRVASTTAVAAVLS